MAALVHYDQVQFTYGGVDADGRQVVTIRDPKDHDRVIEISTQAYLAFAEHLLARGY